MAVERLFPRKATEGSFLSNMNVTTHYAGRAVPSFYAQEMTNSATINHYYVDAIETVAPLGTTTGGHPRQYAGGNNVMFRFDNGVRTTDTTFTAGTGVVQGMCITKIGGQVGGAASTAIAATTITDATRTGDYAWVTNHWAGRVVRSGNSYATITSNTATVLTFSGGWTGGTPTGTSYIIEGIDTKYLLVGFGSSTAPRIAYRDLTTDTSPWTTQTTAPYAQFFLITKAGADAYGVTDAGVAVLGEYRISKCPAGNDPRLKVSWGNGLEVGTPEWPIVSLAAIGDSVVAGKADGLYYYNDQTKRFENVMPHLVGAPHALNGKGMKAVTNGVLYPTHDGKLYFFDGVAVQEVTPLKGQTIPRDVLTSRITAIADNGDTVAVVTECWQNTTQNFGLTVFKDQGGFTDITTNVKDGSLATGSVFAGAAPTLYVGADVPFEAVIVRMTRNVNAASASFNNCEYSDGAAGWPNATGFIDGSILGTAGISLVNTGFPTGASNAVLAPTDIDWFKKMQPESVNGTTKYWMRFTTTGTITAGTEIDEVEIVPGRAGLPDEGLLTQATNFTNRDRAGGITHVWLGKRERTVGFVWHDVYALNTLGGVWALAWHTGRVPGGNLGQPLILWGRYKQMFITEGPTRDPARTLVPSLAYFSSDGPGPVFNLVPEGTYLGDPTRRKEVKSVYVDTKFASPDSSADDDAFSLYMQWDEADIKHVGSWTGGPAKVMVNNMGEGRIARFWLAHDYGIPAAPCAQIVGVDVEYEYVGEQFDFMRDRAIRTPETT